MNYYRPTFYTWTCVLPADLHNGKRTLISGLRWSFVIVKVLHLTTFSLGFNSGSLMSNSYALGTLLFRRPMLFLSLKNTASRKVSLMKGQKHCISNGDKTVKIQQGYCTSIHNLQEGYAWTVQAKKKIAIGKLHNYCAGTCLVEKWVKPVWVHYCLSHCRGCTLQQPIAV